MRLTGQSHLSPSHLGGWTPIGGTFEIDWSISFVPNTQRTFEIDWSISFVPEGVRRLDTYGGTSEIDRSISNVPDTLRRLDPYGGTFEIYWSISFVLANSEEAGHL